MEPPDFTTRIVDFHRLLDGENRSSTDPEDAEHWYRVYADLLGFKQMLLGETSNHVQKVPETKQELTGIDIPFLEAEMERLREGLAFWEARRRKPDKPA